MTTKAKGNSIRQKLTDLSKKLGVQYENLETAFLIEQRFSYFMAIVIGEKKRLSR
jgi:hypothetical protein